MRIAILLSCLVLGACDMAGPVAGQSAAARKAAQHTELRDAIKKPIDRANTANDPNLKADADRQKAIDDAGG